MFNLSITYYNYSSQITLYFAKKTIVSIIYTHLCGHSLLYIITIVSLMITIQLLLQIVLNCSQMLFVLFTPLSCIDYLFTILSSLWSSFWFFILTFFSLIWLFLCKTLNFCYNIPIVSHIFSFTSAYFRPVLLFIYLLQASSIPPFVSYHKCWISLSIL